MAIYIKYSPAKMNNRQYYKAKEKGPEGPLGGPINLPKRGIQANAKGVKKATWVSSKPPRGGGESKPMLKGAKEPRGLSVSHQKGESKPMLKRGQRATWVFNKPPAKGDQNLMPNLS